MGKFDFKRLATLIENAPGPAPWFYRAGDAVPSERGILRWRQSSDGSVALVDDQEQSLVILRRGAYAMPLDRGEILAWYEPGQETGADAIRVFLLKPEASAPLTTRRIEASKIEFAGSAVAALDVPESLRPGLNRFDFPSALLQLPEILVLGDNAWIRQSVSVGNSARRAIYCLRPRDGEIEVLPQDWFNYAEYDRGYQWITKVARDPDSGRIVGTGMRLRSFVLDESGGNIDAVFD